MEKSLPYFHVRTGLKAGEGWYLKSAGEFYWQTKDLDANQCAANCSPEATGGVYYDDRPGMPNQCWCIKAGTKPGGKGGK